MTLVVGSRSFSPDRDPVACERRVPASPGPSRRAVLGAASTLATLAVLAGYRPGVPTALAADAVPGDAAGVRAADVILGNPNSRDVVIEYFSFSCRHCERFHREVFPLVRAKYLDTGRLLFVLRDFPLNIAALKAAQVAWCGGRDRYVVLHDALWADWESWIRLETPDEALVRIASEHGIAREAAVACLTDAEIERRVLESYLDGARNHGVESTPTFLVNGRRYRGFLSFERFERALVETAGVGG